MATVRTEGDQAAQIRDLLETWAGALRAKDVDAILATHASDVVALDCHGPLRMQGADALRRHLEACLRCVQGAMIFEIHDLDVTTQGDLGFCHYLARCGATGPDGTEHRSWFRGTACFRRIRGSWEIVHTHFSAPFDPKSAKALLDLAP